MLVGRGGVLVGSSGLAISTSNCQVLFRAEFIAVASILFVTLIARVSLG